MVAWRLEGSVNNPSSAMYFRQLTQPLRDSLGYRHFEDVGVCYWTWKPCAMTLICYVVPEAEQLQVSETQGQVPQMLLFNV